MNVVYDKIKCDKDLKEKARRIKRGALIKSIMYPRSPKDEENTERRLTEYDLFTNIETLVNSFKVEPLSRGNFDEIMNLITENLLHNVVDEEDMLLIKEEFEDMYSSDNFSKSNIMKFAYTLDDIYIFSYWKKELMDQDLDELIKQLEEIEMKRQFFHVINNLWLGFIDDDEQSYKEWFDLRDSLREAAEKGALLEEDVEMIILYLDEAYVKAPFRLKRKDLNLLVRDLYDAYKATSNVPYGKNAFYKHIKRSTHLRPLVRGRHKRIFRRKLYRRRSRYMSITVYFHQIYSLFINE